MNNVATIILAAGKGTRMKSDLAKVLHPLLGSPMLSYAIALSLNEVKAEKTIVVVGHQADQIEKKFADSRIEFVRQDEQLGTGHAVLQALPAFHGFTGTVLILCGDVPLVKAETLRSFIDTFWGNDSTLAVLTAVVKNSTGYGRIIRGEEGWLERIVEEKDASDEQRLIREVNTGIFCVRSTFLIEGLKEIGRENAQGEYYLTDLAEVARKRGLRCSAHMVADPMEVMGINTRVDLATAIEVLRLEKIKELMLSGVTIIDPKTTYVDQTVVIGKDTMLYPNCTLQGKTRVGEQCVLEPNLKISDTQIGNGVTIRSHCVITESRIDDGAIIGPFSHLRPQSEVKTKAKIGNFVEVKNSIIGKGSKANHLAYIGDALVGKEVNIGAGTITCNYDGFEKHQTVIGDQVFVGSNVELVAPVKVGDRSSIGAGTTVTKNVPEGALAISRVKQKNIRGWSKKMEIQHKQSRKKKD
ncbi:MAG: bifunctional UDP-N-acetylglucosamine diphosphorylase/glucosamine-1-phosphate N-acetyltransferase GlmU [Deltaproteobacteria bacterium]|nr:bifunctional UDP-N-acetylglucosamine diphosphorylase/glucosamine-1-phosphate N-acetyltransferase GlmU [Deltaproteobacteria bacterium]